MADSHLSRRAMLALSAAFGGIALSGAAKAEPLTNLCLEVPLAPGPNRAEQMLAQMAWAGSLITTMQEGKDPELEAQVAQACSEGLFSITSRRNPPREVSGARLTIDGVAQPGTYAIEHDTGWTLSIKTTAKGKVVGHAMMMPNRADANLYLTLGLAAIARYGLDAEPFKQAETRVLRRDHPPTPTLYVERPRADGGLVWRTDGIDWSRERWDAMNAGLYRPARIVRGEEVVWEQTDFGGMIMKAFGADGYIYPEVHA